MATVVNMHEAKSSLSRLVKRAAAGEDILIANHGKPVARLTRVSEQRKKAPWGLYKGKIRMADDFDAALEEFKDYM
jgi:prevent-host-death family protein